MSDIYRYGFREIPTPLKPPAFVIVQHIPSQRVLEISTRHNAQYDPPYIGSYDGIVGVDCSMGLAQAALSDEAVRRLATGQWGEYDEPNEQQKPHGGWRTAGGEHRSLFRAAFEVAPPPGTKRVIRIIRPR